MHLNYTREKKSIIGLLGGAGPEACIDVQRKILQITQKKKAILSDHCHYHVITDNNTNLINRDKQFHLKFENLLIHQYKKTLDLFEAYNVSFGAITCNSAHLYFQEIQSLTKIKLVNMIDCVVNFLKKERISEVGLLSSFSTYKSKLYDDALKKHNIYTIVPSESDQIKISHVIYAIKAGLFNTELSPEENAKLLSVYKYNMHELMQSSECQPINISRPDILLKEVIVNLQKNGVRRFVLGCTELPLINNWLDNLGIEYIDANMLLALALVEQHETSV